MRLYRNGTAFFLTKGGPQTASRMPYNSLFCHVPRINYLAYAFQILAACHLKSPTGLLKTDPEKN